MVLGGFAEAARAGVQFASVAASSGAGGAVAASSGEEAGAPKDTLIFGYIPNAAIHEATRVGLVPLMAWTDQRPHEPCTPTDMMAQVPQTPSLDPGTHDLSTIQRLASTIVVVRSPGVSTDGSLPSTIVVPRSPLSIIDPEAAEIEKAFESSSSPMSSSESSESDHEYWKLLDQEIDAAVKCGKKKSFREVKKSAKKRRKVMPGYRSRRGVAPVV
jgi:hypothetical protein